MHIFFSVYQLKITLGMKILGIESCKINIYLFYSFHLTVFFYYIYRTENTVESKKNLKQHFDFPF